MKKNAELTEQFYDFLESHDLNLLNRHLREIFLGYLQHTFKASTPLDFDVYTWELQSLFDLLDKAADYKEKKT